MWVSECVYACLCLCCTCACVRLGMSKGVSERLWVRMRLSECACARRSPQFNSSILHLHTQAPPTSPTPSPTLWIQNIAKHSASLGSQSLRSSEWGGGVSRGCYGNQPSVVRWVGCEVQRRRARAGQGVGLNIVSSALVSWLLRRSWALSVFLPLSEPPLTPP